MIALPAGAAVYTLSGLGDNRDMSGWCGGAFTGRAVTRIPYPNTASPAAIPTGVTMLDQVLQQPGPKIIVGHSEGAQVISRWIATHHTGPPPEQVVFITLGNPLRNPTGRGIGIAEFDGRIAQPTPDSRYRLIDVARGKDPWAIKDCCPWWLFWWYSSVVHPNYQKVNLNDPANRVVQRGNTTLVTTP